VSGLDKVGSALKWVSCCQDTLEEVDKDKDGMISLKEYLG